MPPKTLKDIRAKAREMLADPDFGQDQTQLGITIKLGQSSMSRFMGAPDGEIPSVNGDSILCLLYEIEKWERGARRDDEDMSSTEKAARTYSETSPWPRVDRQLENLLAIGRSDVSVEEKQIAFQEVFGLYAEIGHAFGAIMRVKQED